MQYKMYVMDMYINTLKPKLLKTVLTKINWKKVKLKFCLTDIVISEGN